MTDPNKTPIEAPASLIKKGRPIDPNSLVSRALAYISASKRGFTIHDIAAHLGVKESHARDIMYELKKRGEAYSEPVLWKPGLMAARLRKSGDRDGVPAVD